MSRCIVNTVDEWLADDCTEFANSQDQQFFDQLFTNFYSPLSDGIWVPGLNNPSEDDLNFQYLLGDLCNPPFSNGGKCSTNWTQRCSTYSRSDTGNPIIRQFCGCYLPQDEYNSQTERACDTICSGFDNVKFYPTPTSTSPQDCQSNVCIIDNVTIEAVGSSVGDITFSQLCRNCGPVSDCRCIISDINIISEDSRLGQLNLAQNCGSSTQCFARNSDGSQMEVNCDQYLGSFGISSSTVESERQRAQIYLVVFIFLAIILLLLLIVGLYSFIRQPTPIQVQTITI